MWKLWEVKKEKFIKTKEIWKNQHKKWKHLVVEHLSNQEKNARNWNIEFDVITMAATISKLLLSDQLKWMSYKFSSHTSLDAFELSYI